MSTPGTRCLRDAWMSVLALAAAVPVAAQTVRGTIVDEPARLPVSGVLVTLLRQDGTEILPGVRSDSLGTFALHAARAGTYRVKATRIGYRPLTSEALALDIGQLAVVQLRMTTVAQQLIPVRIVERRRLTMSELMTTAGFDLRQSKGVGRFLNAEELARYKLEGTGEVLRSYRPAVSVVDGANGPYLSVGPRPCQPEIYLDGFPLTLGGPGYAAFAVIDAIPAQELYGIEVYRVGQVPPPSLGARFGETRPNACVVAVWTKNSDRRVTTAPRGPGLSGIQVLRGVVLDFESGMPVAGVPVSLLSETSSRLSDVVRSDSLGELTIRTNRIGPLRLEAGSIGRGATITPIMPVAAEELILFKLFVSARKPIEAPLAIVTRLRAGQHAVTDVASFAYRRERGIAGVFLSAEDIRRRGIGTLAALLRGIDGVIVAGAVPSDTIMIRTSRNALPCPPAFFFNGTLLTAGVDSTIRAVDMSRVFGVEVYTSRSDVPPAHADGVGACGMVGVWMQPR